MSNLQMFELLEDLEAGREAPAVLLKWEANRYVATSETIMLHDYVGQHGMRGDRGYCWVSPHSQRWEAVSGLHTHDPRRMV